MKQIYLDNGATSFPKAPGVGQAMKDYIEKVGVNVNRSSYRATAEAALSTLTVREDLCQLFGAGEDPSYAIFTSGVTMSLNMIMKGTLHPGDHLIISGMEHNAVARPATQLEAAGVKVSIAPCDEDGVLRLEEFEKLIIPKTRLVVMQYASNVSGTIQPIGAIGAICRRHGVLLAVDSAQAAGHFAFDMQKLQIDALCFTGHKGLLGPQGTGLLVLGYGMSPEPLLLGGTGSMSESVRQPDMLPDRYESGTVNLPGIAGLYAGLKFVRAHRAEIEEYELALCDRLRARLREISGVRILCDDGQAHMAITSIVVPGHDGGALADALDAADIAVRAGLHCAPTVHAWLGTLQSGAIRFSPGLYNTAQEMDDTALLLARLLQA